MIRIVLLALGLSTVLNAQTLSDLAAGKAQFESRCGGCHGGDGKGGVRAPDVVTPGLVPQRSDDEVRQLITEGLPDRGMPGFSVPEPQMGQLVAYYQLLTAPAVNSPVAGDVAKGEKLFSSKGCSGCHTRGSESRVIGPDLSAIGSRKTVGEIETAVKEPSALIEPGYQVVEVRLKNGQTEKAFARNRSSFDLQLQTFDGRFRFLSMDDVQAVADAKGSLMPRAALSDSELRDIVAFLSRQDGRAALAKQNAAGRSLPFAKIANPDAGDWPSYNGLLSGNRHSKLTQINQQNVGQLVPAWVLPVDSPRDLEMTPIVVDGVMYITASNLAVALDAATGREIWTYQRPRTTGVMGDAGSGANRGAAVAGDKVFMVTDHAHMIALDRLTGQLVWETEMADYREHYGGTLAPLVVKDVVIGGVGGGDEGIRGFLAAYDVNTGEERWRFWTVPLPGEPLSETWVGSVLPHGCGGTWLTGTYDPQLDLLYWPIGNPCPDMNGDERDGDNLYSDSILALDPDSGELKWYYQYTPHDEFDWDANQTPVLVDADWQGKPRKLLLHANRNGFFYVLDRTNGELLRGKPFVEKLTWASGIGADGRPVLIPDKRPTPAGNIVCPGLAGATNWLSPAYDPNTKLYYVQTTEYCQIFTKREEQWESGKGYFGGAAKNVPGEKKSRYLRALDVATGETKWEVYEGDGGWKTWGGVLSTDGGVVFFGDDSGAFAAVSAESGKPLWHFHMNANWRASPMTYTAGGKQFVAIAATQSVVAFALPE